MRQPQSGTESPSRAPRRGGRLASIAELLTPPADAPPKPDSVPCGCGAMVEAQWWPGKPPRWIRAATCATCLKRAEQGRRRQRAEAERQRCLRERLKRAGLDGVRRRQTFRAFRPVPGTTSALAAAQAFSACEKLPHRGLLFVGTNGAGKTLLATAILNAALDRDLRLTGAFVTFAGYLRRLRAAFSDPERAGDAESLRLLMESVDLLVVDDLGAAAKRRGGWDAEELVGVLDARDAAGRPLIATTDLGGEELEEHLGPRVVSRLYGMCRIVPMADGDVEAQDYRRRR